MHGIEEKRVLREELGTVPPKKGKQKKFRPSDVRGYGDRGFLR